MANDDQEPLQEKEVVAKNDAYTGMLAISLICLIVGCGLLFLDYQKYDYGKQAPKPSQVPKLDPNPAPPMPANGGGVQKKVQKKAPPPVNKGGNPAKKAP